MAYESREGGAPGEAERSGDLIYVEAALARLVPRPARLDAVRLMYLAGRESAARSRPVPVAWIWPAIAAVSTVAATVLSVLLAGQLSGQLFARPAPQVVERIVYVPRPAGETSENRGVGKAPAPHSPNEVSTPETPPLGPSSPAVPPMPTPHYLQARNLAMSEGIESLPAYQAGQGGVGVQPATYREMQHRILEGEPTGQRKLPQPGFYFWPAIILRGDFR